MLSSEKKLQKLIVQIQQKNVELENERLKIELKNKKLRKRTINLFGKLIELKKAKNIIDFQNNLLEIKNEQLEKKQILVERKNKKLHYRTIKLFGKMIELKKAKNIIAIQNEEVERKGLEIARKNIALEKTTGKFRERTIELFGKMVDLRKAYNVINKQKKEIEDQRVKLDELNASKDKFFSIIAHDLKNPIGGFLNLTEIMSEDLNSFSDNEKQEFIDLLHSSAKQLYSLLENLLHWSRAQTGKITVDIEQVDVFSVIQNNIGLVENSANVKHIKISNESIRNISVLADVNMLNTIIRNLLTNAIKFSYENSTIEVLSEISNDKVNIVIKDHGVGVSQENLNKLFLIDQNVSTNGTNNEHGTGLGLILCKEFAQRMNGDMCCESELNVGSSFIVTLPLCLNGETKVDDPHN